MSDKTAKEIIEEHNSDYGHGSDSYMIKQLRDLGLTDEQIAGVLGVVQNTCPYCFDGDRWCVCMRDD